MTRIDSNIQVDAPLTTVYNQWTQFEEFPGFMEGVEEVRQLDVARLHWVADIGGKRREWDARIVRQIPDEIIAWQSETPGGSAGTVIFTPVSEDQTDVEFHVDYPEDAEGMAARVEGDLERFKEFIESRGMETGAWRGEIRDGEEWPVAPLQDSSDAPDEDIVQFGVSPLDSGRSGYRGDIMT